MSDRLGDRLLWTPCQALAERILNEPDKDLITTFQPEQHAHEIKWNVISVPSQIKHTAKGLVWKCSIKKNALLLLLYCLAWSNLIFFKPLLILKSSGKVPQCWGHSGMALQRKPGSSSQNREQSQIMRKAECHGHREWLRLRADSSIQHILTACDLPRQKSKDQAKVSKYGIYYEPRC